MERKTNGKYRTANTTRERSETDMRKDLRLAAAGALSLALATTSAVAQDASESMTVTNAKGDTVTLTLKDLPDSRGYVYCELVFDYGDAGQDIYSTSPIAPCDLDWWDSLDLDAVAAELDANSVTKNGPQYWAMDEVAVMAGPPTSISGVDMNYGATLPPGTVGQTPAYGLFNTAKTQNLTYYADQPIYQLLDANGYAYVLQGQKVETDQLATLGDQFQELPEGWSYHVVNPWYDLVIDLVPNGNIPSVQDEFDQIYILIPTTSLTPVPVGQ